MQWLLYLIGRLITFLTTSKHKRKRPGHVRHLRARYHPMTSTIHVQWVLPTFRADGTTALSPAEIASVTITQSFNGVSNQSVLKSDAVSFDTSDVSAAPGDYTFDVIVTDTAGRNSAVTSVTINVPAAVVNPPGPVTALAATLVTA
jgi:hypothetical protein